MTFITAAIIGAVATAGATAYSSKQARKAQRKAREDQQLRDLIEGAAPNISAVEEIMAEEIGQQDAALLDDALKQMDYQTQQAQEGADFAAQAQADQALQQTLTEEGILTSSTAGITSTQQTKVTNTQATSQNNNKIYINQSGTGIQLNITQDGDDNLVIGPDLTADGQLTGDNIELTITQTNNNNIRR